MQYVLFCININYVKNYKTKIFKVYAPGLDKGYFEDLYNSALVATIDGIKTHLHFINIK